MVRSWSLNVVRLTPEALAQSLRGRLLAICAHTDSGRSIGIEGCFAEAVGILHKHSNRCEIPDYNAPVTGHFDTPALFQFIMKLR